MQISFKIFTLELQRILFSHVQESGCHGSVQEGIKVYESAPGCLEELFREVL